MPQIFILYSKSKEDQLVPILILAETKNSVVWYLSDTVIFEVILDFI